MGTEAHGVKPELVGSVELRSPAHRLGWQGHQ